MHSLIQTASIDWRMPVPSKTLPLLALAERQIVALAAAKNTEEPDDEQIKRAEQELGDTLSSLPDATELRITVRTATIVDQARYKRLANEASRALNRLTGSEEDADETDETEEADPERDALMIALYQWAICMSVLERIEERAVPYIVAPGQEEPDPDAGWKTIDVPAWISDPEQYVTQAPQSLHKLWHSAAENVNPGVWFSASFLAVKHGLRS